jgi:hypothetical protein
MRNILALVILITVGPWLSADDRPTIDSLVGREIFIRDGWAGQSMKVAKLQNEYQVIRTYFGSGRPVVGTVTYRAQAVSEYQLRFSEIDRVSGVAAKDLRYEEFVLSIIDTNNILLLHNGLQVVTEFDRP